MKSTLVTVYKGLCQEFSNTLFFFFYLFCQRGLASYIKPDCHKIKSKTHDKGFSSLLPFISSSAHQKQTTQKKNRPRELVAGILSCLSPKFEQLFARQSVEICSNHEDSLSHNKNTLHKELSGLQTFSYCSRNILTLLLCQIPAGFHLCWISSLGKPQHRLKSFTCNRHIFQDSHTVWKISWLVTPCHGQDLFCKSMLSRKKISKKSSAWLSFARVPSQCQAICFKEREN